MKKTITPAEFRAFRESLGLNIQQMAERYGYAHKSKISNFETGCLPVPARLASEIRKDMLLIRIDNMLSEMMDTKGPITRAMLQSLIDDIRAVTGGAA